MLRLSNPPFPLLPLDKQIQDAKDQEAAYLWDGEVNGASMYTSIIEILEKSEIKAVSYTHLHRAVWMLDVYHIFHILRCEGFKIQLIRNIEVGADRLRVVVDNHGLIAFPGKRPGGMYGAVIELDALSCLLYTSAFRKS